MKDFIIRHKLSFTGALAGSLAGFLYWYFVGCTSGSCAITSDPLISTGYFALIGVLAAGIFEKKPEKKRQDSAGT